MSKNSTSKISTDEYPEVTQSDLDRAIFRQGLKPAEKKERITIMLDPDIIRYFKAKAGERGYQTLINNALREFIADDSLRQPSFEQMLRRVIREELASTEYTP
ncbi:MAG: hypothetical protein MAG431_02298 [Chloroflexi bacterium]|nr:hypothetical protein [Chloroflexota bacterium]